MILQAEFGEPFGGCESGRYTLEQFVWRGRIRLAFFRLHPSGCELVCVCHTGYPRGQKLPRR